MHPHPKIWLRQLLKVHCSGLKAITILTMDFTIKVCSKMQHSALRHFSESVI